MKGIDCLFTPVQGPSTRAWKAHSRRAFNTPNESKSRFHTDQSTVPIRTYPILIDDIYDGHQFASMGSERDVGNTANLNKTLEHLRKDAELHLSNA